MFLLRRSVFGVTAVAVLLSIGARGDTVRQRAEEAQRRTAEYPAPRAQSLTEEQQRQAAALAELARQRGRAALADRAKKDADADADRHVAGENSGLPAQRTSVTAETDAAGPSVMTGRLIVALSSSMPLVMVHDYMRQLADVPEAIVVLRGFVGGAHTVAPTGKWIEEARRVDPGCMRCGHYRVEVVVDPLVYRNLKIEMVPAVAYVPGVTDLSHCNGKAIKARSIAYGATSVEGAVRALVSDGSDVPVGLIEKVRRKEWEQQVPKRSGS